MARVFNGSTQYTEATATPISGWPLTIAAWARTSDNASAQSVVSLGTSSGVLDYIDLQFNGSLAGDPIRWLPSNGSAVASISTTGYSVNVWHHLAGRSSSNTDHAVFLDGGSKGTNASSLSFPTNVSEVTHGSVWRNDGRFRYLSGSVFWPAIWNVALEDAEIASLAAGVSPLLIRPDSLVYFSPLGGLDGDYDNDIVGGLNLTAYNSPTWSDDSPSGLIYPSNSLITMGSVFSSPIMLRQIKIQNQRLILK